MTVMPMAVMPMMPMAVMPVAVMPMMPVAVTPVCLFDMAEAVGLGQARIELRHSRGRSDRQRRHGEDHGAREEGGFQFHHLLAFSYQRRLFQKTPPTAARIFRRAQES